MTLLDHAYLAAAGLIAASYSTLIGGGTLLTVPTLIVMGIPPHTAVATNRVGVFGLSITGWIAFQQQGLIRHALSCVIGLACGAGAIAGTLVFLRTPEDVLRMIIGIMGMGLLLFATFKKDLGVVTPPKVIGAGRWLTGAGVAFLLGAYGSIYGAGLGTFLTYLLIFLFGQTFLESAGTRKIAIGLQSLLSAIMYIRAGLIQWPAAANLFVSMAIGSYIGARYGTQLGNVWIRRMFLVLAAFLTLKMFL